MNGILLITHEGVGKALLQCVTYVYGACPEGIEVCTVQGVDFDAEIRARTALARIKAFSSSGSVLVLTDIYGASPSNVAVKLADPGSVAVLSGVNMPMLLRAITYRNVSLECLCEKAIEGGMRGIMQIPACPEKGL